MLIDSVRGLKAEILATQAAPFLEGGPTVIRSLALGATRMGALPIVIPSIAIGVAPLKKSQYGLAVRCQRPELMDSPEVEEMKKKAKGEIDVRFVGRLRRFGARPWYQKRGRPLRIGHSCGHFSITAGTLGCFVKLRGDTSSKVFILSNNHVLAAENQGKTGDAILQPGKYDRGAEPEDVIAKLSKQAKLKKSVPNKIDAAIALVNQNVTFDPHGLKDFGGRLAGVGGEFVDEGTIVCKQGRTTGLSTGKVTAFELDNVVVQYDSGNLRFDDQIEIEGAGNLAFSAGGDSGSVIFEKKSRLAIGLLFAGGDSGGSNGKGLTFANPIHAVLEQLKIELV